MEFENSKFGLEKFWKKQIKTESFGKVMEFFFTNTRVSDYACMWFSQKNLYWLNKYIGQ